MIVRKLFLLFALLGLLFGCDDTPTEPRITAGWSASCYEMTCSFVNQSTGANHAIWTLGDGSAPTSEWEPTYRYPACDEFFVTLQVCPGPNSAADKCDSSSGLVRSCP